MVMYKMQKLSHQTFAFIHVQFRIFAFSNFPGDPSCHWLTVSDGCTKLQRYSHYNRAGAI